jgi:SAM-dependent methyltransferase
MEHTSVKCPICKSNASVIFTRHPGYQDPKTFDIARCDACSTSYALGDSAELSAMYDAIYRQAEDIPGYSGYLELAKALVGASDPLAFLCQRDVVYWGIRDFFEANVSSESVKVLEVGSGLGYLTYSLNHAGFNTIGLDISETAVKAAALRYGDYYVCDALEHFAEHNGADFDTIVMTEVIEHLEDVYPFLRACMKLLKPGGQLLVTTPNKDAWAADVLWETDCPPVHLWWFSASSFQAIANELGCTLAFLDLTGFPGASSWRLGSVEGSPRVTQTTTLDASGHLAPRLRPERITTRASRKLDSALSALGLTIVRSPPYLVRKQHYGISDSGERPSPRIFAVLTAPADS